MSDVKYKVTINGYGDKEKGTYYIEEELAEALNIERKEAQRMLESGKEVIKEGLSQSEAENLVATIAQTGANVEMEDCRFDLSKFEII